MKLAECTAVIIGTAVPDLPDERVDAWLRGRNLGILRPSAAAQFEWPGHWIARLESGSHVVMFGVPSGVVAGDLDSAIAEAFVIAPLDLHLGFDAPYASLLSTGVVEAIIIAGAKEAPSVSVDHAEVRKTGIVGDRYEIGAGTFSRPNATGLALTMVEAEALEASGVSAVAARRNIVTRGIRLGSLIGARFTIGEVVCEGTRLAQPCAHLGRVGEAWMLKALVHRGGIRVDVITPGSIERGASVQVVDD